LDLNKLSDLSPHILNPNLHRLDDIKIPMHLLSRFDFIVDIPRDATRQTGVALEMYSSLTSTCDLPEENDPFRTLRVLIAYLRTAHGAVSFPADVREYMKAKHGELVEANRLQFDRLPWLSDFQTRTTVSIAKFTAAAARLADRSEAHKEDVDLILPFVARKYDFLRSFQPHLIVPASWDGRRDLRVRRTVWVLSRFAGQKKVAVSEIVELAETDLNEVITRRAFYRILEELREQGAIKQLEYGYYDFSNALNEKGGGK